MGTVRTRVKNIIMDKAPEASTDALNLTSEMGLPAGARGDLADALAAEFSKPITGADLDGFTTVAEVCTYVEGL